MTEMTVKYEGYSWCCMVGDAYLAEDSDDELVLAEPDLGMPIPLSLSRAEAVRIADVYNLALNHEN